MASWASSTPHWAPQVVHGCLNAYGTWQSKGPPMPVAPGANLLGHISTFLSPQAANRVMG